MLCVLCVSLSPQVRKSALGPHCLFIFVAPPSHEELERRLRHRGTETEDKVLQRLANAESEIAKAQVRGAAGAARQHRDSCVVSVGYRRLCVLQPGKPRPSLLLCIGRPCGVLAPANNLFVSQPATVNWALCWLTCEQAVCIPASL